MTTRCRPTSRATSPTRTTLRRLIRKGTVSVTFYPDPLRLGLQEQGRAAAARRGDRLPAVPARRAGDQGHRPEDRRRDRAPRRRRRAAVDARLQDHERSVRRHAHLLPHLFRASCESGIGADQHREGQARAHRPHAADACEQPRGDQGGLRRRHRRGRRPEGHDDRRHALRSAEAGDPGAHGIPRAGHRDRHRAELQGRPGEDGRRRSAALPARTRPSASRPTRNPARRSSPAWASCTSTSSSTA